jgi:hypothetical protein
VSRLFYQPGKKKADADRHRQGKKKYMVRFATISIQQFLLSVNACLPIYLNGDALMRGQTAPLHHYPNTQGLDQATQVPADAWVQFLAMCRGYAQLARRRQAEQQKAETATSGEAVQELP